jgi:hypothetical protein
MRKMPDSEQSGEFHFVLPKAYVISHTGIAEGSNIPILNSIQFGRGE